MMKYVYKNEKGLVVLNEKVEILDLASIDDLRNEVKAVNENLKRHELQMRAFNPEYTSSRTFFDKLNINSKDQFTLNEDVFYWDKDVNEFLSYESVQSFNNPFSWTDEEKVEFMEILLIWISVNDHTADLYDYLRDISEDEEYAPQRDKFTDKFERLFHKELENDNMLDFFEMHYQKRKQEYKQYIQLKLQETVSNGMEAQ
ncbi:MAG TPA: hypothetical protein GXX18_02955 [Bacillales bacterium]|nr:hypothetical protein [Bacillales bacterium]